MLCQHCNTKQAEKSYIEKWGGKAIKFELCLECSNRFLYGNSEQVLQRVVKNISEQNAKKVCSFCGRTYGDYQKTGLVGCANCYNEFYEDLFKDIKSIQGTTEHIGKAMQQDSENELWQDLNDLQEELEQALRERRYQEAQILDEKIQKLSQRLNGGGSDGGK